MKVIGITGGVGSGKSALLAYIKEHYSCRIILADQAAHQVKEPGQPCYEKLVELLSKEILDEDGTIHKEKMAAKIFSDEKLLEAVNAMIHPAVKEMILSEIQKERIKGEVQYFFVEAALLIEGGYLKIVDEMWYIYAEEKVRRQRLSLSRGYSEEKIDSIMASQLSEAEFRECCNVVIDNSRSLEEAIRQIDRELGSDIETKKKTEERSLITEGKK